MSIGELPCTYAALILHDEDLPITAERIATLAKAENVKIDSYWPPFFAKLVEKKNVDDLILSVGSGGGGVAASVSAAVAGLGGGASASADASPAVVEEQKKERKMAAMARHGQKVEHTKSDYLIQRGVSRKRS
uniref:60S acidic ribosomal protein P1 n=1 Tax=Musa acuminata subsp. malaccensis TaxID=214687 RepID=A0A804JLN5_MUSAM